jgi:adenylylsulfate kinase-like enzyme
VADPYEPPDAPELTIDTRAMTAEAAADQVLHYLTRRLTAPETAP